MRLTCSPNQSHPDFGTAVLGLEGAGDYKGTSGFSSRLLTSNVSCAGEKAYWIANIGEISARRTEWLRALKCYFLCRRLGSCTLREHMCFVPWDWSWGPVASGCFSYCFFFFFFCILSVLCIFPPSPICYSFSLSPPTMQILFTLSILCVIYPPKELEGVRAVWPERCKTFDMTWLNRIVSGIKLVELVNEKLPVLLQFSQNAVFEHWFQQLWWWKCWQDTAEYSK